MQLDEKAWYGRTLVENILAVEVPVISAVNGPCSIHAEVPLLSDIVLASDTAYFQDLAHFPRGLVPGDGSHVLWPMLVGPNRARSMLLMGKKLGAQEAVDWGVVAEVLPQDQLVDRVWEIARDLALRPPLVLRYTRQLFMQSFKRAFLDELDHGLARDVCPAAVLPSGRRNARTRPCLGSGTLVGLTTCRSCSLAASGRARRCYVIERACSLQRRNLAREPRPELRDAAGA